MQQHSKSEAIGLVSLLTPAKIDKPKIAEILTDICLLSIIDNALQNVKHGFLAFVKLRLHCAETLYFSVSLNDQSMIPY